MISTACPPRTSPLKLSPARTSPIKSNVPGRSMARTAYPSRTERASGGKVAIRGDSPGQHAARRRFQCDAVSGHRRARSTDSIEHRAARLLKCERGHMLILAFRHAAKVCDLMHWLIRMPVISAEDLTSWSAALLEVVHFPRPTARLVGESLVAANLRGVDSHGVQLLPTTWSRWSGAICIPPRKGAWSLCPAPACSMTAPTVRASARLRCAARTPWASRTSTALRS